MSSGTPIESHPVAGKHARALRELGYTTVEEVAGAAASAGDALTHYLKEDIRPSLPQPPLAAAAQRALPLGVAVERVPPAAVAFFMAAAPPGALPASANLIGQMPAVRDQGDRGTCVAHASLAAVEQLRTSSGQFQEMSEQFLYWNCKQNDGFPNGYGTWIGVAMPLLQRDGCCLEAMWPYNGALIPGNESHTPPPPGAAADALTHRIAQFHQLPPTSVVDIKRELVRGRAVPFSIPVFNSWYDNPAVRSSGDIVLPFPGEARAGGHAMCMVGYQDDPAEEDIGGGRFLLRNSWDSHWGAACPLGAGYGTIPYAYIMRFGLEAYSIE